MSALFCWLNPSQSVLVRSRVWRAEVHHTLALQSHGSGEAIVFSFRLLCFAFATKTQKIGTPPHPIVITHFLSGIPDIHNPKEQVNQLTSSLMNVHASMMMIISPTATPYQPGLIRYGVQCLMQMANANTSTCTSRLCHS